MSNARRGRDASRSAKIESAEDEPSLYPDHSPKVVGRAKGRRLSDEAWWEKQQARRPLLPVAAGQSWASMRLCLLFAVAHV